jgi:hypothetical protein
VAIDRGTVLGSVVAGISGAITQLLWYDMIGVLLNTFALQNIPINELKGQIGIIFFALTLLSVGILIGKFTNKRRGGDVTGIENKGKYKSKLRDELRDLDDQPQ